MAIEATLYAVDDCYGRGPLEIVSVQAVKQPKQWKLKERVRANNYRIAIGILETEPRFALSRAEAIGKYIAECNRQLADLADDLKQLEQRLADAAELAGKAE